MNDSVLQLISGIFKGLPEGDTVEVSLHNHAQPTDVNVDGFTTRSTLLESLTNSIELYLKSMLRRWPTPTATARYLRSML